MKTILKIVLLNLLALIITSPIYCQMVQEKDALTIADNWINVILDETGSWGEYNSAEIESIADFMRKDRKLGYFCQVKPRGFILVSLRKELAPVKAYSALGNLNPDSDNEGANFLKTSMERILDTIQSKFGPIENIESSDLADILEIDYSEIWDQLYSYVPGTWTDFPKEKAPGQDNYQEGEILLEGNNWHQFPPYNDDCPWMNCSTSNGRAVVGCVATAGAQIMHHWDWPPYGNGSPYNDYYDWANMPDVADENDPQAVIDALAELNYEVGLSVGMGYGCDGSGASTANMEGVYENTHRYSTACNRINRPDYTFIDWYDIIKVQLNLNRPMQHKIPGHSILVDGWQEVGTPYYIRQYHVNYGWTGTGNDAWFTLDAIPGCDPTSDYIIRDIVPNCALGNWIFGYYPTISPNYRYFDRDASGYGATFQNGQFLQFLDEVKVTGVGAMDPIIFDGSDFLNLRMFTGGDLSHGIRIYDASIELTNYGSIKFYDD